MQSAIGRLTPGELEIAFLKSRPILIGMSNSPGWARWYALSEAMDQHIGRGEGSRGYELLVGTASGDWPPVIRAPRRKRRRRK